MATTKTEYKHILLDDKGSALIAGTKMKVIALVLAKTAYGWSPEELKVNHPYLTLGQIHAALAYYWDHQAELDHEIEKRLERVERLQQHVRTPPLLERLKSKGLV